MRNRHTMIALLLAACLSAQSTAQEIVKPVSGFTLNPPLTEDASDDSDELQARQESIASELRVAMLQEETRERPSQKSETESTEIDDPIEFRLVDGESGSERRSA